MSSQGHNLIKNIMGHCPVCYIPKVMEIEPLVPRDKMFKAFQNIWAWKPSVHVTNIFISSYLKVYIQNFVKEGQVVSSLSSEIRPLRQICQGQSMGIIYTHYDGLDVDATYKVSCNRSSGSGEYFERFITCMSIATTLVMCPTSCHLILFSSYEKACIQNLAENGPLLSEKSQF